MQMLKRWTSYSKHDENLRKARIGLVGKPSSWLIASGVDLSRVSEKWGFEFIEYPLSILEDSEVDENNLSTEFQKGATKIQIPATKVDEAAEVATVLLDHIRAENLDGVTVQCFDFLMKNEISGCLALCHANNQDGITAGCEGDIPTTITMLIAKELTGIPSFMANVTSIDRKENTAVLAHCTVPTSILEGFDLMTHYETNMSVGVRGRFDTQHVTVMKIFGEDLSDYWISSGRIIENLEDPDGCRTQIRIKFEENVDYFLNESFGNHHIVIPGNHKEKIEEFFAFKNLRE
jgi:L-fucose isomerase-like protein